jgi:hypothetical protein
MAGVGPRGQARDRGRQPGLESPDLGRRSGAPGRARNVRPAHVCHPAGTRELGRQPPALPRVVEKPGRTKDEASRCWHGPSILRHVEVAYSDGRVALETLRCVVVHSSQLAQQHTSTSAVAQAKEAHAVAAMAEYEGRGQGRRGRRPRPWRDHAVGYHGVAAPRRPRRARRGRPAKTAPQRQREAIA